MSFWEFLKELRLIGNVFTNFKNHKSKKCGAHG